MRAIVGAVKYMHAHGAVHRDLKPENVCLTLALLGLGYLLGLGLNPKPKPDQVLLSDAEVTDEISPISSIYLPEPGAAFRRRGDCLDTDSRSRPREILQP